jgi:hypothetical protein
MREGVLRAPMPLDYAQPWVDPRDIGGGLSGMAPLIGIGDAILLS